MKKLNKIIYAILTALVTLNACGGGGSGGGTTGTTPIDAPSVNLGSLRNGSSIQSSSGAIALKAGEVTTLTLGINGGDAGYSGALSFKLNGAKYISPNIMVIPSPCKLATHDTAHSSCQLKVNTDMSTSMGSYSITPVFSEDTGGSTIKLNDIKLLVTNGVTPKDGSLSILVNQAVLISGESTIATVSLDNSVNVPDTQISISNSNVSVLNVTPETCFLSTLHNSCQVTIKAVESGSGNLLVSATGYSTVKSTAILVNPKIIPGNLSISLESSSLLYGVSTNATVSLIGSSYESAFTVSINSESSILAVVSPESCVLSSLKPTCQVTITAGTEESGLVEISALASGYIPAQSIVEVIKANTWTWMGGGDNLANYGKKGEPNINNIPGVRNSAINWTDNNGNLWMFGGGDMGLSTSYLNDLWQYNVNTNMWTWVTGANKHNESGIYGVKGQFDAINIPGARYGAVSWVAQSGNLWLFGGYGIDVNGKVGSLNDLWLYDIATNMWAWISGSNVINDVGSYGTKGQFDITNVPSARVNAVSWVDKSGNLWLFGGHLYADLGGVLNDLWKYDVSKRQWMWMNGANTLNASGIYGVKGQPDAVNTPGARQSMLSWADKSGDLWLFGGSFENYDKEPYSGNYNDLWRYNITTNTWTWMSGANTFDAFSIYGVKGQPDINNMLGARASSLGWVDNDENLWLFGGSRVADKFNDLWVYNIATNMWTWIGGSTLTNQDSIFDYNKKGVASANYLPSSRDGSVSWVAQSGDFWLFGGLVGMGHGRMNDLWKYHIAK